MKISNLFIAIQVITVIAKYTQDWWL